MGNPSIIKAQKLCKSYGEHVAVDGLSFEIHRGETLGLLGPNGAGKTTTISMLVGLLRPDQGSVVIGDNSAKSKSDGIFGNPMEHSVVN